MPCGPLVGFQEIGTHSKVRGGYYVSTFSGRSMIILLVSEPLVFQNYHVVFKSLVDISGIVSSSSLSSNQVPIF